MNRAIYHWTNCFLLNKLVGVGAAKRGHKLITSEQSKVLEIQGLQAKCCPTTKQTGTIGIGLLAVNRQRSSPKFVFDYVELLVLAELHCNGTTNLSRDKIIQKGVFEINSQWCISIVCEKDLEWKAGSVASADWYIMQSYDAVWSSYRDLLV